MTAVLADAGASPWLRAFVYLAVAVVAARVVDFVLARRDRALAALLGREPDRSERTRFLIIRRLAVVTILFVGTAIALLQFPVVGDLARALLASAAILAGITGIAARAPIANLASGVMVAFAQPVRLHDHVAVGGVEGTVERLSLTYTWLRTPDGCLVAVPNESLAAGQVRNFSLGGPTAVTVTVSVPAAVPPETVAGAARVAAAEAAAAAPRPAEISVAGLALPAAEYTVTVWTDDPAQRARLADDLRAALLRHLRAAGVAGAAGDAAGAAAGAGLAGGAPGPAAAEGRGDGA